MAVEEHVGRQREVVTNVQGELFRFYVESRVAGKKPHLVDLEEFGWNGGCSCMHFETRMRPALVRGAFPAPSMRCWHVEKARDYFLRNIGPTMAKQYYKKR